jgi:hypothetical protein
MHFRAVFLLAPMMMWAASGNRPHLFLSFPALQQLDSLSANRIESLDDAKSYVEKAAALFGVTDPSLMPGDLEPRLAAAELAAAKDPDKLVSDDRVAEAFNFLSDEFRVANPQRLTGADILLYRSVQASIFPHAFSPKSVNGSRPLGALVMLSQLIFNGGVTEGVRNAAKLDRPPGTLKVVQGGVAGKSWMPDRAPNLIARRYQAASLAYFAHQSTQEILSFLDRLSAMISAGPNRRWP